MEYSASVMGGNSNQPAMTGYIGVIGSVPAGSNYIVVQGGSLDEAKFNALQSRVSTLETAVNNLQTLIDQLSSTIDTLEAEISSATAGTNDYNNLLNKPRINNIILQGNKLPVELGLSDASSTLVDLWSGQTQLNKDEMTTINLATVHSIYDYVYFILTDESTYDEETNSELGSAIMYEVDADDRAGENLNFIGTVNNKRIQIVGQTTTQLELTALDDTLYLSRIIGVSL